MDLIVHAGDVGTQEVLETLQTIAKVHPVRGNVDGGKWTDNLPFTEVVQVGQVYLYLLHDLNTLDLDPEAAGFQRCYQRPFSHTKDRGAKRSPLSQPRKRGAQTV